MAENVAVVLLSNANLGASNDGAGKRGAEEVAVLVDGVALDGTEDNLIDELALEILDDHALGTEGESLLLDSGEVLLLADIGEEALIMGQDGRGQAAMCWIRRCLGSNIPRRCNPIQQRRRR